LGNLSVLPEYRHNRIGAELLRHAIGIAREHQCKMMHLSIAKAAMEREYGLPKENAERERKSQDGFL
jgi:ribosomal protein S18 acetylase RimI-like enzyme